MIINDNRQTEIQHIKVNEMYIILRKGRGPQS